MEYSAILEDRNKEVIGSFRNNVLDMVIDWHILMANGEVVPSYSRDSRCESGSPIKRKKDMGGTTW